MDSDDDLPPLLPLTSEERPPAEEVSSDEDSMPGLIPVMERRSILRSAPLYSDDDMPTLMSVSDFSDDADVSSFHFSSEDEASDWEDEEFGEEFDDELLPSHEYSPESPEAEQEDEDVATSYLNPAARIPHYGLFDNNNVWFPPHRRSRSRGIGVIPESLLDAIALRIDSIIPDDSLAPSDSNLERAKVLTHGLERVSGGLLERMLKVGGAPGAYEDLSSEDKSVSGCAICWETLLQNLSEAQPDDVLPFAPQNDDNDIVCLPCAHVFHSPCLIRWFSLKTSCPTCRFNIDPNCLTSRARNPDNQALSNRSMTASDMGDIAASLRDNVLDYPESEADDYDYDNPVFQVSPWATAHPFGFEIDISNDTTERSYRRSWTRPNAPGKSLRENIEEKEREMGLRCLYASCIFAPTDEVPHVVASSILPRITITAATETVCKHDVHAACLVKSVRAAGWNPVTPSLADVHESEPSTLQVGCPSCFALGRVSRRDWEEGVIALAQDSP
ncbi:hypothetical protein JB92DRAFT_2904710 [Gautieria morchelliformis]|nr:hypothetical protein JB92DRAFT_2904710 [Gautieria morchelliformis]